MKNLKILVLLGSLALNAAFVAAWAASSLRGERPCGREGGIGCPLYRQLEVSPEQWKEIEPRLKDYQDRSREYCVCIDRAKNELIDLVSAPEIDRAALEAKQKEILANHQKMQSELVDHLVAEKKILNPEQQARLFGLLKSRGCGRCGSCGAGRGGPGCRSKP